MQRTTRLNANVAWAAGSSPAKQCQPLQGSVLRASQPIATQLPQGSRDHWVVFALGSATLCKSRRVRRAARHVACAAQVQKAKRRTQGRRLQREIEDIVLDAEMRALEHFDELRALTCEADVARRTNGSVWHLHLQDRLSTAHAALTAGLQERSVEATLLLLAALSGEHLFLCGPPGTAKSLLSRRLAEVCDGNFFQHLLTRFTVPEELFGPLSLKALEADLLSRKVAALY
eukprot:TRINITY_DN22816_c0_g1_i2.p1 TRINITY_DN22816_c0_g1~~TRINITY_DN22816_c0_g1_i2.p1  ORF type:complete len:231 (-),score=24.13 TRINITY_DN22816_c0_g1_i2:164-856(-)